MRSTNVMSISVTLVGGPTAVLDVAGLRIITDPTFDAPQVYHHPIAGPVTKKTGPAFTPEELGHIDVALASHEHIDNLDVSGRGFLTMVPKAFTTTQVAEQFGPNVVGLTDYESATVPLPDGGELKVTAVPAHHGPDEVWPALGPVVGFILEGPGVPTIYVSGDNSELDIVEEIAQRYPSVDVAVLFVGGAKFDVIADGSYITLSNERAVQAARLLGAPKVIAVHEDSWEHFSQNAEQIRALFESEGLGDAIVALQPGESATLDL
ncbi:MBL fold metallo-hydrolase [Herbiconiux sp. YIM B11900]|uniref:MBL fold metallo-hydrolase n=1 Tax=Herbiconiux sp. YIM B11900 TaxID=3404131 RepID=UPI003F82FEDE